MLLESQILEVFNYQKDYFNKIDTGTPRSLLKKVDLSSQHVKIITGIRRSGKSTLLYQLLKKTGIYNFISFEDPRLTGFGVNDFFKLERIFQKHGSKESIYFFDEIQNIPGWEKFVRILHDKKARVIISGSNASLLSRELGTGLTGRQISYELYPFSYKEFLLSSNKPAGEKSFNNYLLSGGFPEYLKSLNEDMLIQLFNDLIYRDIVVRHNIRNARVVKELAVYMASNIGKEFSYNNLSKNFDVGSINTILSYISFFEDAYLFFPISKFSYSLKKQAKNPKKIYGIDTALMGKLSMSFTEDRGRKLENIVFIDLKRGGRDIYYYKNKNECDFVVVNNAQIENVIQVCYELHADNMEREINGLTEAMTDLKKDTGLILTFNQTDDITIADKKIHVKPVWKWLTE